MMHLLEQRVIHDYTFFKEIILIFHGKRKKTEQILKGTINSGNSAEN